jgi:hypothetical protein
MAAPNDQTLRQIEDRLTRLEEELRQIRNRLTAGTDRRRFEATAGSHEGSQTFAAMVREGRKLRRAEQDTDRAGAGAPKDDRSRQRPRRTPVTE